jgi:hypothetical protein
MTYIIQKGEERPGGLGHFPRQLASLPGDLSEIVPGDWQYSYVLSGWVGREFADDTNKHLYEARIAAA